jgi:hypothetical protein
MIPRPYSLKIHIKEKESQWTVIIRPWSGVDDWYVHSRVNMWTKLCFIFNNI